MTEIYVGQKFEVYGLPTKVPDGRPGMYPPSNHHVEIVSISVTGKVCFRIHIDDEKMRGNNLHDIPLERVALMRQMGFWRTNSERWPT